MTWWLAQTLVSSTLLIWIVLMLRGPAVRQFGAKIAYALWLLPALRMILPPLPGWREVAVPAFILGKNQFALGLLPASTVAHAATQQATVVTPETLPQLADLAPLPALPAATPTLLEQAAALLPSFGTILLALWLGGALLWFGWQMLHYRLFLNRALKGATLLTRECGIDVLISDGVDGPAAAGLFKRRIFLPTDFLTRYKPEERRLALVHEAAHHDRWDIPANFAALVMLSLHWFNPFAHRAYRAFRADQELACDATVLAGTQAADRLAYGHALLKSASGRMPAVACALSHKAQLAERIQQLKAGPKGLGRVLIGAALAMTAIGGGLLVTASGEASTTPTGMAIEQARIAQREAAHALAEAEIADRQAQIATRHADREGRVAAAKAREAGARARIAGERARAAGERARVAGEHAREAAEHQRSFAIIDPVPVIDRVQMSADIAAAQAEAMRSSSEASARSHAAIASAKAQMAARCSAEGHPIDADASWSKLGTCGNAYRDQVRAAMAKMHAELAMNHEQMRAAQDRAREQLRRSMEEMRRSLPHAPAAPPPPSAPEAPSAPVIDR